MQLFLTVLSLVILFVSAGVVLFVRRAAAARVPEPAAAIPSPVPVPAGPACPCGACVTCACSSSPRVDEDGLCVSCGGQPLAICLLSSDTCGPPHVGVEAEGEDAVRIAAILDAASVTPA